MNLPDAQQLQDAEWQVAGATERLTSSLEILQLVIATPPTNPALRPAYDRYCRLYEDLQAFFTANTALVNLLMERETEMNEEMTRAKYHYNQMGLDRDYWKAEAQHQNTRFFAEIDKADGSFAAILNRITKPGHA